MLEGIFHLEVKALSRSAGRSSTAAIAYRSGSDITDERTGERFNYKRKTGVLSSSIFLPIGSPTDFLNRSILWNAVEKRETRKNSTVAREIVLALPADLSSEMRRELAEQYARELVSTYKIAAEVSIHRPHVKNSLNHHAHILMSTRAILDGEFTHKTREWDDMKDGPKTVTKWRKRWAEIVNQAYTKFHINKMIDPRSFAERGIDLIPTVKMGVVATAIERRNRQSDRGDLNRSIREINILLNASRHFDPDPFMSRLKMRNRNNFERVIISSQRYEESP